MEKSRAIELLEHLAWDRDIERNPYGDALNMAIEALKAQLSQEGTTSELISKFIDGLEEIFADLREQHVDDSVCGLCEYDGAYMGQSGDWCNECPGFDRDDCFKLSDETRKKWTDEIIKALPTVQPEPTDIDAREAVYNLAEKIGIHQLFALTVELRGEPIQPEPHEGHWIRRDCGFDVECKCSRCGYKDFVAPRDEYWFNRNFCPNCGARMKGEQNARTD